MLKEYCEKTNDTPYAQKHKHHKEYEFVEVRPEDPMQDQIQLVSLRAGSLLVWSSEYALPFCTNAYSSTDCRTVTILTTPPNSELLNMVLSLYQRHLTLS